MYPTVWVGLSRPRNPKTRAWCCAGCYLGHSKQREATVVSGYLLAVSHALCGRICGRHVLKQAPLYTHMRVPLLRSVTLITCTRDSVYVESPQFL